MGRRRAWWPVCFVALALLLGAVAFGKPSRKPKRPSEAKHQAEGKSLTSASSPAEASPTSNVVASPVITLYSDSGQPAENASSTPLRQARDLLVAGQESAAVDFLRQVVASASARAFEGGVAVKQEPELRRLLADLLTVRAAKIRGAEPFESLPEERATEVQGLLREARDVESYALERWRGYLETLGSKPESQAILAAEGQALFTKFGQGLASASLSPWRPTLERQETIFVRLNLPLERLACLELLARIPGIPASTGTTARTLREELLRRRREFLERLDWLIVRGEAWEAEILLAHLGRLDGENPMLPRLGQRLQTVKRCQELLLQVSMAVRDGDFPKATALARQVLEIDGKNPHALEYLKKIEELQRGPKVPGASGKDKLAALRKELRERLKDAERREDLVAVRKTLKEFLFWGIAEESHREKLRAVEAELMDSRFHLEDRWKEAQELFRKESWDKLRRLLNRNPALGEDPKRVFEFWEMNLVCDFAQERMDPGELMLQVGNLEKKHPKSFWALWLRMRLSMDRRDYPGADEAYFKALELQPEHPALKAPGRILWAQRHGWKIIPFLLLLFFYILGRSLPMIVGWLEEFGWRLNTGLIGVMPGLALRWLESRFGAVREGEPRLRLFRLLTRAAFAARQPAKGERYAELLMEMAGRDQVAIEHLGRHVLAQPVLDLKRIDVIVTYAMMRPDDKVVLEKAGKAVVAARSLGPEVVPLLKRYLGVYPDDRTMTDHLAGLYQTLRPSEVGRDGMELMERAWRVSGDETLWVGIWRVQVACGLFDRARDFLLEAAQAGRAPLPLPLLEAYEQELLPELTAMQRALAGSDRPAVAAALKRLPDLRYLNDRLAGMVLEPLESLALDEDTGTKYLAQKARDQVRETVRQSGHFRKWVAEFRPPASSSSGKDSPAGGDKAALDALIETGGMPVDPSLEVASVIEVASVLGAGEAPEDGSAEAEQHEVVLSEAAASANPSPGRSEGAFDLFEDLASFESAPMVPEPGTFDAPFPIDLFADLEAPGDMGQRENPLAEEVPEPLGEPSVEPAPSDAAPFNTPGDEVSADPHVTPRVEGIEPVVEGGGEGDEANVADPIAAPMKEPVPEPVPATLPTGLPSVGVPGVKESLERLTVEFTGEALEPEGLEQLKVVVDSSGPDDLPTWEQWLTGPISIGLLQTAVRLLGGLKTPLLTPILLRFAGHPHPRVRANVIEGLEANRDPQAIPVLSGFLRDQDNRIRANAIKALQSFGLQSVVGELRKMVDDPRVQMRDSAIYVLRGLKSDDGTRMLARLLKDKEATVRRNAIRALAQQGRVENLEPLRLHLGSVKDAEERDLCEKAIKALKRC